MRVGGTNCDAETKRAFDELGARAEVVHFNEIVKNRNNLWTTMLLFFRADSRTATTSGWSHLGNRNTNKTSKRPETVR